MQDKIFRALLIISAIIIPVIGVGIVFSLVNDASGAFEHFGFWNFIFSLTSGLLQPEKKNTEHCLSSQVHFSQHCLHCSCVFHSRFL